MYGQNAQPQLSLPYVDAGSNDVNVVDERNRPMIITARQSINNDVHFIGCLIITIGLAAQREDQ